MIREVNKNDLDEILQLYLYLHEKSIPEDSEQLRNAWENIINDVKCAKNRWNNRSNRLFCG